MVVSLLDLTFLATGVRIVVLCGGPCMEGPGLVVGNESRETIRSNHNIERDTVKHYKCATKVGGASVRMSCYSLTTLHFLITFPKELRNVFCPEIGRAHV